MQRCAFSLRSRCCSPPALPAPTRRATRNLQINAAPGQLDVRWDIALRDLDVALDLDSDADGKLTWGEVRAAWPRIEGYALRRLSIDGCPLASVGRGLERRNDGAYAVLLLRSACTLPTGTPRISYGLFADVDPTHRGIAKVQRAGQEVALSVLEPTAALAGAAATPASAAEAARGIARSSSTAFSSADAPARATSADRRWEFFSRAFGTSSPVTTTSCSCSACSCVGDAQGCRPSGSRSSGSARRSGRSSASSRRSPSRTRSPSPGGVEAGLADAGVHRAGDRGDDRPRRARQPPADLSGPARRRHVLLRPDPGFGFAGVLAELNLPRADFAWALLQFNLGLEVGQLVIVALATSVLFGLRRWRGYPKFVIGAGSMVAIAIGVAWLVERIGNVSILPF
jgi:hypothetical protein